MGKKMWDGRFQKETDQAANDYNTSLPFDCRMYEQDILGSLTHCYMLEKQGIISKDDASSIEKGLISIRNDIESGKLCFDSDAEDIHMFIEAELTNRIGEAGKRLHTGRSRNDQVALDLRLYLLDEISEIRALIMKLHHTLICKAMDNLATVMPGYTHLQRAQPITLAHHLCAYIQMLQRDVTRLDDCKERMRFSPLGSGALAGTTYPLDREFVAAKLNFRGPMMNSLDGVSDRDYAIELAGALSILMMHLSRFSEEIILWSSQEFAFVELDDAYSTGSSIMPQKKNPDMAELIRGKTGRVYGNLTALLTVMKGLPLAYNKDLQEDKEGMFDSADTIITSLTVMNGMLSTLTVNRVNMEKSTEQDFSNATELADYLAAKGLPFRKAHELVGLLVLDCIKKGIYLQDVNLQDYQMLSPLINDDVYEVLKSRTAVSRRNSLGGTGFESVKKQIEEAKKELQI